MPRLSLYRPEKGNDYKFFDKTIWEQFQIGGTDVLVHRYLGPGNSGEETASTPTYEGDSVNNIQDLLFLENRDRKYDPDVYQLRGHYSITDIDFNLSQFGLFLQNDTLFVTFHINDTVEKLGRKIIAGDVLELPHLKDEYALNDLNYALKRFYVIEEVNRAAEGFSPLWYPHLYRAKCVPMVDSQEFKEILDDIANTDAYSGAYNPNITYFPGEIVLGEDGVKYEVVREVTGIAPPNLTYYQVADTLRDIVSTYEKEMQITQAVLDQAEEDSPQSGYDVTKFFHIKKDDEGKTSLVTADSDELLIPSTDEDGNTIYDETGEPVYMAVTADTVLQTSEYNKYPGYLTGDGVPQNGAPFTQGIAFPINPIEGQYALRTDYLPNRLFRYNGVRWQKIEDDVRTTMSNLGTSDTQTGADFEGKDERQTQLSGFVNNDNQTTIDGKTVKEKQSLSKALRPEADE